MSNWDPHDPVRRRIMYFERIKQGQEELIHMLPFYQVTYPGLHGRAFEPVDCLKRKQLGCDSSNSSQYPFKTINEIKEYDPKTLMFYSEEGQDRLLYQLHAFGGCEWPL